MRIVDGRLVSDEPDYPDEPTEIVCEGCGNPFAHSGPGRKPKKCSTCRQASTAPRAARGSTRLDSLREPLIARYFTLAQAMAMIHPAYGAGIREKAEAAADADIEYAKVNPAFRRFLQGTIEKTAAAGVIAVHAEMFRPMMVGTGIRVGLPFLAKQRAQAATRAQPGPRMRVVPEETPTPGPDAPPPPETVNAGAMPGMPA